MLSNHEFMDKKNPQRYCFLSCDSCSNFNIILFDRHNCRFSSSKCEPHIVYMSEAVYVLCSEDCLRKFIEHNTQLFDHEVRRHIIEDNYFFNIQQEESIDDMETDVTNLDGVFSDEQ